MTRLAARDVGASPRPGRPLESQRDETLSAGAVHALPGHRERTGPQTRTSSLHRLTFEDGNALEVGTLLWATGFRPDYGWLEVPVLDAHGAPVHQRGVTAAPGFYFLGLKWLYRADSSLLGGVGRDAAFLASHIAERLGPSQAEAPPRLSQEAA